MPQPTSSAHLSGQFWPDHSVWFAFTLWQGRQALFCWTSQKNRNQRSRTVRRNTRLKPTYQVSVPSKGLVPAPDSIPLSMCCVLSAGSWMKCVSKSTAAHPQPSEGLPSSLAPQAQACLALPGLTRSPDPVFICVSNHGSYQPLVFNHSIDSYQLLHDIFSSSPACFHFLLPTMPPHFAQENQCLVGSHFCSIPYKVLHSSLE